MPSDGFNFHPTCLPSSPASGPRFGSRTVPWCFVRRRGGTAMSNPVVSVVDVSRTIAMHGTEAVLLAPVSVNLHSGTLVAVSGPSGSGKTTLCNIIIGWERSDTGSVQWADDGAQSWARLAVAPQRLALLPSLDIRENLALPFWSSGFDVPEPEFDA